MSDTSPEALLAWCEGERKRYALSATSGGDVLRERFAAEAAKWEALAALVRAHQERPTRAQVEAEIAAIRHLAFQMAHIMNPNDTHPNVRAIIDRCGRLLALYGPEAPTTGGEEPSDG